MPPLDAAGRQVLALVATARCVVVGKGRRVLAVLVLAAPVRCPVPKAPRRTPAWLSSCRRCQCRRVGDGDPVVGEGYERRYTVRRYHCPAAVASSAQDPVWRRCACRHGAPDVGDMDLRGFAAWWWHSGVGKICHYLAASWFGGIMLGTEVCTAKCRIGVEPRAGLTRPMLQSKHLSLCLHTRDLFQPAVVMRLQPQAMHRNCWPHPHAVLHYPQTLLQSSQPFHPYPIIHPELYKVNFATNFDDLH